jgi:HTH-type transcriptional regulator/antitoxin HigA
MSATNYRSPGQIEAPDPINAIRIRMEQKNLRQRDLEPMIGSRGRVSEVLSGKRALTLPMIRRLAEGLDLGADVLIQETGPSRKRRHRRGNRVTGKQKESA